MNKSKTISFTILGWLIGMFLVMLISGCSRQTPVSEINDGIQTEVAELVDYAKNNMVMDTDKQFLLSGAQHCAFRANDMAHMCEQTISSCHKEISWWKLASALMTIIAGLFGFLWIKK